MEVLEISDSVKEILELAQGASLEEKVLNLVFSDIERRLSLCSDRVIELEKKYGMSFREFEETWQRDEIQDKYSHEVERDYMVWESLDDEHRLLLSKLRKLKEEIKPKQ